ncbi:uncharacterized protein (DUF1499 family) [Salsuginibacillus halophilus]|uniref:Uncharacterized protein (DUF1499 family) n=1 Tax=Salsuginibacillus halophilus TaxID=517424 RepID=A0A2P8HBF9_9BACI|nr:DUF1499 domain-containing protein [Salsuginibacillus halophilus]PSL43556.1 uncharacterized protein (DUF1499 family) [Salsuginibacillus halophilus]
MPLPECPKSPNCVSTMTTSQRHAIEPYVYEGTKKEAYRLIQRILEADANVTILKADENYLEAEFKTKVLRFKDDVIFYFGDEGRVHFLSKSRLGYSDLGKNRQRMEILRKQFHNAINNETQLKPNLN